MYIPPDALDIVLKFISPYSIPAPGEEIVLRFGFDGDAEIIPFDSEIRIQNDISVVGIISIIDSEPAQIILQSEDSIFSQIEVIELEDTEFRIFSTESVITPLPEIESESVEFKIMSEQNVVNSTTPADLPNNIGSGFVCNWKKAENIVETHLKGSWKKGVEYENDLSAPWGAAEQADKKVTSSFTVKLNYEDFFTKKVYGQIKRIQASVSSSFILKMDYLDNFNKSSFADFKTLIDFNFLNPFSNTQPKDYKDVHHFCTFRDSVNKINVSKQGIMGVSKPLDSQHGTFWGPYWYSLWCQEKYIIPDSDSELRLLLRTDFPLHNNPSFVKGNNNRCPFDYWYSGGRDTYKPSITPITSIIVPRKKVYYMINSAFINRLPDQADVSFISISASIDRDSWVWHFNITLASKEALDLVKPEGGAFKDIQININGWKWTCRIENWSRDYSFGSTVWKVSGKSPSIEIGEPYSCDSVFSNSEGHGGQIVDSILTNTGWSADWKYIGFNPYMDWLVPASTLNLTDSAKIKQIKSITDSVSAFVQTAADTSTDQKIIIMPKYGSNPWHWDSLTPEIVLNDSICHAMGSQNEIIKPVDSVIVSGSNQGVVVNARRDGTAGSSPAAMVFDDLITTKEAGAERARHIIGNSGTWIKHSLKLFSLMPPETPPGLLLPGDFIQMDESNFSWKGQVTGTSINAGWNDSDGLTVNQDIEVEQYYG